MVRADKGDGSHFLHQAAMGHRTNVALEYRLQLLEKTNRKRIRYLYDMISFSERLRLQSPHQVGHLEKQEKELATSLALTQRGGLLAAKASHCGANALKAASPGGGASGNIDTMLLTSHEVGKGRILPFHLQGSDLSSFKPLSHVPGRRVGHASAQRRPETRSETCPTLGPERSWEPKP